MKKESSEAVVQKSVRNAHGLIELRSDNILVFRPDLGTFKHYELDVLQDLHRDFVEITDGVPRPYMADNRHISGIVGREEQEYMDKHFEDFATHAALVTHSPVVRVLVNSYNVIFKPKVKIKLFANENAAVKWLLNSTKKD